MLQAKNLTVARDRGSKAVDGLNLELHRSEVLGIAGVDGNGQIELLQALAGLRRVQEGDVLYEGQRITQLEYPIRLSRGIHFVSGDRRRYGIIPGFSIGEHFSYVLGDGITPRLPAVLAKYNVVPADPRVGGDRLSGGNQQKMLLARVCERRPRVLLLAYPTTGLDVQASIRVREFLLDLAMEGAAIVIASSDLDELMSVCHRIVVMDRGRIAGEQASGEFDRWQLAEWFTGGGVRSANTSLS